MQKMAKIRSAGYLHHTKVLAIAIAGVCTILGLSRSFALYKGMCAFGKNLIEVD